MYDFHNKYIISTYEHTTFVRRGARCMSHEHSAAFAELQSRQLVWTNRRLYCPQYTARHCSQSAVLLKAIPLTHQSTFRRPAVSVDKEISSRHFCWDWTTATLHCSRWYIHASPKLNTLIAQALLLFCISSRTADVVLATSMCMCLSAQKLDDWKMTVDWSVRIYCNLVQTRATVNYISKFR